MDCVKELKSKNVELEKGLEEANARIEQPERDKRKKNLIIKGLPIETNDNKVIKETVETFIERNHTFT